MVPYERGHWEHTCKLETFYLRHLVLNWPDDNLDSSNLSDSFISEVYKTMPSYPLLLNELKNHSFQVHNPSKNILEI